MVASSSSTRSAGSPAVDKGRKFQISGHIAQEPPDLGARLGFIFRHTVGDTIPGMYFRAAKLALGKVLAKGSCDDCGACDEHLRVLARHNTKM